MTESRPNASGIFVTVKPRSSRDPHTIETNLAPPITNLVHQARQPFREMEGVYLVAPTAESVEAIKRDFKSPSEALYSKVHLFFLERVPPDLLQSIKQCSTLISRLKTFKVGGIWSIISSLFRVADVLLCRCDAHRYARRLQRPST